MHIAYIAYKWICSLPNPCSSINHSLLITNRHPHWQLCNISSISWSWFADLSRTSFPSRHTRLWQSLRLEVHARNGYWPGVNLRPDFCESCLLGSEDSDAVYRCTLSWWMCWRYQPLWAPWGGRQTAGKATVKTDNRGPRCRDASFLLASLSQNWSLWCMATIQLGEIYRAKQEPSAKVEHWVLPLHHSPNTLTSRSRPNIQHMRHGHG